MTTTTRVWTWFTSSDHSEFYRTLDGNTTQDQIYLLLPFIMDKTLYPDLSDPGSSFFISVWCYSSLQTTD